MYDHALVMVNSNCISERKTDGCDYLDSAHTVAYVDSQNFTGLSL